MTGGDRKHPPKRISQAPQIERRAGEGRHDHGVGKREAKASGWRFVDWIEHTGQINLEAGSARDGCPWSRLGEGIAELFNRKRHFLGRVGGFNLVEIKVAMNHTVKVKAPI